MHSSTEEMIRFKEWGLILDATIEGVTFVTSTMSCTLPQKR